MAGTATKTQIMLARLTFLLLIILIIAGIALYGVSTAVLYRYWHDIIERPGGPMTFRFILQPTMAVIAAVREGIKDAETGRSPYFWTVVTNRAKRINRLHEGMIATARIILLGLAMDMIYQVIVLKTFYPGEAVFVALALAFLPYVFLRGPVSRIARWWRGNAPADKVG